MDEQGQQKLCQSDIRIITHKTGLRKADFDNLFDVLRISAVDQENSRRDADTSDFKLQGSAILLAWLKREGKIASRYDIIKALQQCDVPDASEFLEQEWGMIGWQQLNEQDIRFISSKAGLTKADLDNLFEELEIAAADQEQGRRNADTLDFKLQGFTVLQNWRKYKGRDSTRYAIIKALQQCDLIEAVEFLDERWSLTSQQAERDYFGQQTLSDADIHLITCEAGLANADLDNLFGELEISAAKRENWRHDAQTTDFMLQGHRVLLNWRKYTGQGATRNAVIKALQECDLTDAVEFLDKRWSLTSQQAERDYFDSVSTAGKTENDTVDASSSNSSSNLQKEGQQTLSEADIRVVTYEAGLVKADLDNLFGELEISAARQERGRREADTLDFKRQGSYILQNWRKYKGRDATRYAIIKALQQCDLIYAAEFSEEVWGLTTQKMLTQRDYLGKQMESSQPDVDPTLTKIKAEIGEQWQEDEACSLSEVQKKFDTQVPQSHFKVSKIDEGDHDGWRIASFQDITAHLVNKGQQLLGKNKELQCRIAFMGKVTISKGRLELESEYLKEPQYKLLAELEPCLDIDQEFNKELSPLLFVEQHTTHAPDAPDMSISQLVSSLLTEIREWIPLRKHTLAILNGIADNLCHLDNREDIDRAMGKSVPVALGLALVGTSLLSILTGGAAAKYCSYVVNEIKAQSDVSKSKVSNSQLKEYLTKYCCGSDLQSAVSVVSKDVEVSVYIQQLVSSLKAQCSKTKKDPVEELTTGALQYKKVFELIHGKEFEFKEDPRESAKVLLETMMQTSSVKNPVGLLLDTDHLIKIAHDLAVGSTDASLQLLRKEIGNITESVNMIHKKVSNLNNAYERTEFQVDLQNLFDRIKRVNNIGLDPPTKEMDSLIDTLAEIPLILLDYPIIDSNKEGYKNFMKMFVPILVQNKEKHKYLGKIEVVVIAHGNITEPFIPLEKYFPIKRDDELLFYQPWGMKMACDGAVAIATGDLKSAGDRWFLLSDSSIRYFVTSGRVIPDTFNVWSQQFSSISLPTIEITPFRLAEAEYNEMVNKLKDIETDQIICLWAEGRGMIPTKLHWITHMLQAYAYSLSTENLVKLTVKYAGCLSDNPVLTDPQHLHDLHQQYFYSPVSEGMHDFMSYRKPPMV